MSNAFAPILRARPNPIFGRPVHQGSLPFDYSPILLLKPFGFQIAPDTLSSSERTRWPARHYPHLWIQRPSFERRRDLNPPDSCAAQRTIRPLLTSASRSERLAASSVPKDTMQISRSKSDSLHRTPAGFTVLAIDGDGLREWMPARPTSAASYPISVRRVATLLHASFRRSLAVPPLRFASASPPSGYTGDFHPQAVGHVRHTSSRNARPAPPAWDLTGAGRPGKGSPSGHGSR